MGVQGLTGKRDRRCCCSRTVLPLADERMPAQRRLNANLIPLAGAQPDLDQRRITKLFDDAILADRLHRAWIARRRRLLRERALIPCEPIAPDPLPRHGMVFNHCPVHALRRTLDELLLERLLRSRAAREHDQARGVAIDPVHGKHAARPVRSKAILDERRDRRRPIATRQRHGQQTRRFVDDDDGVVFVDDDEIARGAGHKWLSLRGDTARIERWTREISVIVAVSKLRCNRCEADTVGAFREGTQIAPTSAMKSTLPILQCGNCEPLKASVHGAALALAALCAAYNLAAWLTRHQTHLAVNTLLYSAMVAWEATHVRHHVAVPPRRLAIVPDDRVA